MVGRPSATSEDQVIAFLEQPSEHTKPPFVPARLRVALPGPEDGGRQPGSMRMHRFLLGLGAATLVSATAVAEQITIVSEDQAPKAWVPAPDQPRVIAGYPATAADQGRDVCVNIGYLIRSDGSTANFTRMKTWSSDGDDDLKPYVQAAAAAVSVSRFVPAAKRVHPIYTSTTFAFDGSKALSVEEISSRCRIADLLDHIEKAKVATTNRRWIFRRSDRLHTSDASAITPGPFHD